MILVDSSVFIDYFNGINNWHTDELNALLGNELVITGDYILAEVLQGFRNDKDYKIAKEVMQSFPCFSICSEELAIKSAENFRYLRTKGITIGKTVDLIIGTFCIENDLELLHRDKDFELMGQYLNLKIRE
ncbi:MAG: twitching motility protein PilT [Stygiobacter sp. RIFOXYC12_FULL_38_8]|nr:MAG: twitching motility protein PilT [Stygiobacter sp. RIFOXYB2_FULL_37_11]OGV11496.1 MAG: twitching motility protein PilT [Stygiobacter sp. RIFOXYA2_FULL_38_8]OGV15016.1 MAG: twitching motility protein PilT [Stygiobacter sp. RIFOXYC2_FULL_38_25]OGV22103.1 MAG: twitching motility protein PilT [Stygiobacter sp. RIFOXYC12_FULL_38_8]OGV79590.1 MAG: twitching motility protein PilT [Stygiobacter sp. GWF2_38_21]